MRMLTVISTAIVLINARILAIKEYLLKINVRDSRIEFAKDVRNGTTKKIKTSPSKKKQQEETTMTKPNIIIKVGKIMDL